MTPGGLSESKPSDPAVQKIVKDMKPQIEEKLGKTIENLTVVSYRTQVVAGTNYFIKVNMESDGFAHLRIYKHFAGETSLHSLQGEKTEEEEILYF